MSVHTHTHTHTLTHASLINKFPMAVCSCQAPECGCSKGPYYEKENVQYLINNRFILMTSANDNIWSGEKWNLFLKLTSPVSVNWKQHCTCSSCLGPAWCSCWATLFQAEKAHIHLGRVKTEEKSRQIRAAAWSVGEWISHSVCHRPSCHGNLAIDSSSHIKKENALVICLLSKC